MNMGNHPPRTAKLDGLERPPPSESPALELLETPILPSSTWKS
jgi:hypothetical protein